MTTSFHTNSSEVRFINKLRENIDYCSAFRFSVSFIKKPGLRLIAPNLKAALERCASYFDFDGNGALCVSERFLKPKVEHYNFDYFAGLEVCMELRQPVGERVRSIRYQGEELAEDRSLTLCLNNYRATGTGGYEAYQRCEVVRDQPTEIVELIMDYITRHGEIAVDRTKWYELVY